MSTLHNFGLYIRSGRLRGAAIAGISVATTFVFLLLAAYVLFRYFRKKENAKLALFSENSAELPSQEGIYIYSDLLL